MIRQTIISLTLLIKLASGLNAQANKTNGLPICLDYSELEFNDSMNSDFRSYIEENTNYLKEKIFLSEEEVKQLLFNNSDTVHIQNIWTEDTVMRQQISEYLSENHFYLIDTILITSIFSGIIFDPSCRKPFFKRHIRK